MQDIDPSVVWLWRLMKLNQLRHTTLSYNRKLKVWEVHCRGLFVLKGWLVIPISRQRAIEPGDAVRYMWEAAADLHGGMEAVVLDRNKNRGYKWDGLKWAKVKVHWEKLGA